MKLFFQIIFKLLLILTIITGCASTQMPSLREQCLDPNYELSGVGRTDLMAMAQLGVAGMVQYLLKKGADVNAKDYEGYTALIYASLVGNTDTVEALLEHGADVNAKDNCGRTALMHALANSHSDTVRTLLKHGSYVNAKDIYGGTVLMYASAAGNTEAVQDILKQGAGVNAKTIEVAQKMGHPEIVQMLRKAEGLSKKEMPIEPAETFTIRTHESEFGFNIELSSRWTILSGHELKENPDLVEREFEHTKKKLKEADQNMIEQLKTQALSGGLEVYFHQDYPGTHFTVMKDIGSIPQTNAELNVVRKMMPDFFSKQGGIRIKVYKCELRKMDSLDAMYIVLDFPDEGGKRILCHIQKSPNVMLNFAAFCKNQYFETIKNEFDGILKSLKVK